MQTSTETIAAVLTAAGIGPAPLTTTGHPVGGGFTITPMSQPGPPRAAVGWHPPAPTAAARIPAASRAWTELPAGLARCGRVLEAAGCHVEILHTMSGPRLAVIPPPRKEPQ